MTKGVLRDLANGRFWVMLGTSRLRVVEMTIELPGC
jgi:hypothetical protein